MVSDAVDGILFDPSSFFHLRTLVFPNDFDSLTFVTCDIAQFLCRIWHKPLRVATTVSKTNGSGVAVTARPRTGALRQTCLDRKVKKAGERLRSNKELTGRTESRAAILRARALRDYKPHPC